MEIKEFYDPATFTLTYVVSDEATKDAVIIDPVFDYNPNNGKVAHDSSQQVLDFVSQNNLNIHYILETHAHADHLSDSVYLKEKFPNAKLGIGENIKLVQEVFKGVFNMNDLPADGSQFDELFTDGQVVKAGSLEFKIIFTPGHTPACTSILMGDALFTGDAIFMPDYGTGRCDFPKGDAEVLYNSIVEKIYSMPDETRLFVGHDYQPGGRELQFQTTVGESKKANIRLKGDTTKEQFVQYRKERDATLDAPRLLLPSIQVNINAGKLPTAEENGMVYLKLPVRE